MIITGSNCITVTMDDFGGPVALTCKACHLVRCECPTATRALLNYDDDYFYNMAYCYVCEESFHISGTHWSAYMHDVSTRRETRLIRLARYLIGESFKDRLNRVYGSYLGWRVK